MAFEQVIGQREAQERLMQMVDEGDRTTGGTRAPHADG